MKRTAPILSRPTTVPRKRKPLHPELRSWQGPDGDLLMPHAMRAAREAKATGRPEQDVLADFPAATKPLIPVEKFVGPDGRTVYLRRT